ncbi:RNA polymerase sigma factor [Cohnella sp. 56]|uniref:RNA polymerase sigma factor n=1 Tax=Cohnella sp. 56 TaxID=3113722 RepID=UPI0030EA1234
MKRINLRDMYPFIKTDVWVEVDDEVAQEMRQFDLDESAYKLRTYRHKAYYSLDRNDGIEQDILFLSLSSEEVYEHRLSQQQLYEAMCQLPEKSARRIYAHFFLGMNKVSIAKAEHVDERAVRKSIQRGLKQMAHFLKKSDGVKPKGSDLFAQMN